MAALGRRSDEQSTPVESGSMLWPFTRLDALLNRVLSADSSAGPLSAGPEVPSWTALAAAYPGWRWLRDTYRLTDAELDAVLVAFAPDVDLRYEQLFGLVRGAGTPSEVTVDLVLTVVFGSTEDKLAGRPMFRATGSLVRGRVLRLLTPSVGHSAWSARRVLVDPQIVDVLCGQGGLDDRLAGWCELVAPASDTKQQPGMPTRWAGLVRLVSDSVARRAVRVNLHGCPGSGRSDAVADLASSAAIPLLAANIRRIPPDREEPLLELLLVLLREATLHGALLFLEGLEPRRHPGQGENDDELDERLAAHPGPIVFSTAGPWVPSARVPMAVLDFPLRHDEIAVRRELWRRRLTEGGATAAEADLTAVASRFRLEPAAIANAADLAVAEARLRAPEVESAPIPGAALLAAARAQTGHRLDDIAVRSTTARTWSELVLPADQLAQLGELVRRIALGSTVWRDWGFASGMSPGTAALFTGPSGTGKTLAAQVLATELGVDLFTIDLAAVVSKYIGETEKNLERVFDAAADTGAILFFDEADALFGKRTQVRDAHDRYANVETSYLLQRMERYPGLAVLATNLRSNLDEAFTRRLQFIVDFPLPEVDQLVQLWQLNLPSAAPVDPELDLRALAARYPMSGANVRNVAVAAAFLAAADESPIGWRHLEHGVRREFAKMGRIIEDVDPTA